ncbi:MAG: 50S ribosomal protein L5 [Candidatus Bathyarchaeia archaeon]
MTTGGSLKLSEDEIRKAWEEHPSLKPKIEKVVVNISVGKSGEPLEKATKVLKELTGQTPCKRKAKKTIRDFGIRKGEPIACIVTLRKQKAIDFLKKVLPVIDNKLSQGCFDLYGNFSFGIKEHIEIPSVRYDPDIGIYGMDVCVSLIRPGYRVKNRRRGKAKIGSKHILKPEETMMFVKETLGVEIV